MTAAPTTRPRRDRRPLAFGAGIVALVSIVVAAALLSSRPMVTPPPTPTPSGSLPPVAIADRPPAIVDGAIIEDDIAHDSRDDVYRTPFGAVPAGTTVTLRLRAAAGDLSAATVRVRDSIEATEALVAMTVEATDTLAGSHGYDYWEATIQTSATPTVLFYRFIVADGATTRYLDDDADKGGAGRVGASTLDRGWQITVFDPAFATPAWARGALVYHIVPDRFNNGDTTNDPTPDADDVYGRAVLPRAWTDRPEGACRAYRGLGIEPCTEEALGRDFFGGDLKGITDKLDDLRDLGVTVIALDPIFAAPSNHRLDTSDYNVIDPDLGTQEDFDRLVTEAESRGMRVLLDGVFDHVSSDSIWFDRERRFASSGACEAADSPFRAWFTFRAPGVGAPVGPCVASTVGGTDTSYVGWFGDDTLPALVESDGVSALIVGAAGGAGVDGVVGVVPRWIAAGSAGWRLDSMADLSPAFVRQIRTAAKATNPDALIVGEDRADGFLSLLGDEADSTMNHRFRRAVIGLINGPTADLDGAIETLTPSGFAAAMERVREDSPAPAWDVLMNLVDSPDTTRILWTLTPGAENPSDKEDPANLAVGKEKLRLLATLQLTWPGMSSIYYGTEVGLTGGDDPDDRRPYPWDSLDTELRDWYRSLGRLRAEHEALRLGDLRFVNADDAGMTLAFARRTDVEASVTVLNLSDEARNVVLTLTGVVPAGTVLSDELGDLADLVVGGDGTATVVIPARSATVLMTKDGLDLTPPGPPVGLSATAAPGQVELVWAAPVPIAAPDATPDAADDGLPPAGYRIWRSVMSGGGYALVGETTDVYFVDATIRNGTGYHYVITAHDAIGNDSARSVAASARPMLTVAEARLDGPAEVSQPLLVVDGEVAISARITVDNVTNLAGPTVGLVAQLGFGPVRADDVTEDYTWSEMTFDADVEGADRVVGSVRPEDLGSWNVALRVSTDGRRTWRYADRGGIVDPWGYRVTQALTLTTTPGPGGS